MSATSCTATITAISRARAGRGLPGLATMRVRVGPRTMSTIATISTTWNTPVRYQPGQRYQPAYSDPKMRVSRAKLADACRPKALSLNFTLRAASGAAGEREGYVGLGLGRARGQAVPAEEADRAAMMAAADLGIESGGRRQRDAQQLQRMVALEGDVEAPGRGRLLAAAP